MPPPTLAPQLSSMLVCPICHGTFRLSKNELACLRCPQVFRVINGVPLLRETEAEKGLVGSDTNPLGAEFEAMLRNGNGLTLHIGAGSTNTRYPSCIEFEHKIFRHTDVVGDAHHLPFRDAVFDRVFAFNVFEHLREPKPAAAEILRVLKPGGQVAIHTAFLQALHEPPFHYYNATEFGVREWFTGFEIERCDVSGNFGPGVMLGFLLGNVIEAARASGATWKEISALENTGLGEWADFWAKKSGAPPGFDLLQNLPQEFQKRVAAGFELIGTKPSL